MCYNCKYVKYGFTKLIFQIIYILLYISHSFSSDFYHIIQFSFLLFNIEPNTSALVSGAFFITWFPSFGFAPFRNDNIGFCFLASPKSMSRQSSSSPSSYLGCGADIFLYNKELVFKASSSFLHFSLVIGQFFSI